MNRKKKKRINYVLALKPYIEEFAAAGIKLRIERGDFNSDVCWVNGELQVFINKRLTLKDQKKIIEDLKTRNDVKDFFVDLVERNNSNG